MDYIIIAIHRSGAIVILRHEVLQSRFCTYGNSVIVQDVVREDISVHTPGLTVGMSEIRHELSQFSL